MATLYSPGCPQHRRPQVLPRRWVQAAGRTPFSPRGHSSARREGGSSLTSAWPQSHLQPHPCCSLWLPNKPGDGGCRHRTLQSVDIPPDGGAQCSHQKGPEPPEPAVNLGDGVKGLRWVPEVQAQAQAHSLTTPQRGQDGQDAPGREALRMQLGEPQSLKTHGGPALARPCQPSPARPPQPGVHYVGTQVSASPSPEPAPLHPARPASPAHRGPWPEVRGLSLQEGRRGQAWHSR